jgi:hypothetical protein
MPPDALLSLCISHMAVQADAFSRMQESFAAAVVREQKVSSQRCV